MTVEEKQKYEEYKKKYREAKKQQRSYIYILIKNNRKEYEKFMNNINKQGNLYLCCIFLNTLLSSKMTWIKAYST